PRISRSSSAKCAAIREQISPSAPTIRSRGVSGPSVAASSFIMAISTRCSWSTSGRPTEYSSRQVIDVTAHPPFLRTASLPAESLAALELDHEILPGLQVDRSRADVVETVGAAAVAHAHGERLRARRHGERA